MRKFYSKKHKLLKKNNATSKRKMLIKFFKNTENEISIDKIQNEEKRMSKNKWLYPSNEFGQMEKGVVYDSNTYIYEKFDKENDFEIL